MLLLMVIIECVLFCIRKTIDNIHGLALKSYLVHLGSVLLFVLLLNMVVSHPKNQKYICVLSYFCNFFIHKQVAINYNVTIFFGVLFHSLLQELTGLYCILHVLNIEIIEYPWKSSMAELVWRIR